MPQTAIPSEPIKKNNKRKLNEVSNTKSSAFITDKAHANAPITDKSVK